jgi:hypothetical protein
MCVVAWSNPSHIMYHMRCTTKDEHEYVIEVQFYSKGGRNDAPIHRVEITDKVLVNDSSNWVVYCRPSNNREIWQSLYKKAYTK